MLRAGCSQPSLQPGLSKSSQIAAGRPSCSNIIAGRLSCSSCHLCCFSRPRPSTEACCDQLMFSSKLRTVPENLAPQEVANSLPENSTGACITRRRYYTQKRLARAAKKLGHGDNFSLVIFDQFVDRHVGVRMVTFVTPIKHLAGGGQVCQILGCQALASAS